jgi:acetylxylan esterase
MRRHHRLTGLTIAAILLGLLAAAPAQAASLVEVTRSTWAGSVNLPSYMQMYIYVPDKMATNPPIYISCHSCGSTATGQIGNIPMAKAAADAQGFILILPDNPNRNCWDVGTTKSLTHDGGGDTQAVAQMVKYTISKYNADPKRVYIMGGSGGAMLVQAMLAVYPDVFRAGAARAGVPAGCWADGYSDSNQWSNNCAAGNTTHTAQQWGDMVRAMYPGYNGHRPRLQTYQGDADATISYKNTGEAIKEWTNVLGLSMTPTSMDTGYKTSQATWNRQFWKNSCGQQVFEAWTAPGATHSMNYEEAEMLKFFGLMSAGQPDPEMDCTGSTGTGGAGGASGTGGAGGVSGTGGTGGGAGGRGGTTGTGGTTNGVGGRGGNGGATGTGGSSVVGTGGSSVVGTGGSSVVGTGGSSVVGTGGSTGSGGTSSSGSAGSVGPGTGGSSQTGTGGSSGTGNNGGPGTGGVQGVGGSGVAGSAATGAAGSAGGTAGDTMPGGCSCAVGSDATSSVAWFAPVLLGAVGLIVRRRRGRRAPRSR